MRRHYHVEDTDGALTGPISSYREAKSTAYALVQHARATDHWTSWTLTWIDPAAGYYRWSGTTDPSIGLYTDTITVVPCEEVHR